MVAFIVKNKLLYCEDNGTPNSPVRVLVAMMVLKEVEGLSDQKLFENCRFNMLTRSAIGLLNADDLIPTEYMGGHQVKQSGKLDKADKGRYQFSFLENGGLSVLGTATNGLVDLTKITSKGSIIKWRIKTKKGYRYFTQKEIDTYLVRKQIEETPIEILQKRNNVEATIFQLGYHYPNAKSRYRGLIKH